MIMNKDKIALVTSYPEGTGIFRFVENAFNLGYYSNLIYFKSINYELERAGKTNLEIIQPKFLPPKLSYVLSFKFPSIWSKKIDDFDYVHFASPDFFHLSKWKKTVIGTIHDLYVLEDTTKISYSHLYRIFQKMDLNYCYDLLGITTVSKYTNELLNKFYPNVKSRVIHHWTPEYFVRMDKENCRRKLSLPHSKFIMLNVSSGSQNKNLHFLGKIVDSLNDDFLLVHLGGDTVESMHSSRVLNINQHVDDKTLVELYNAADLYVAPSSAEGFNYPITEALNCGVPVLATDIPIFREVLMDSPYLVPLSLTSWRDAIYSLSDRRELMNAIDWYTNKIGDYYRESRGKEEFYQFFTDLGIKI